MDDGRRVKGIPNGVSPHLLLRSIINAIPMFSSKPVSLQEPVLGPFRSTIGPCRAEATAELCMHIIQLSQCFRVEIDIDRLQPNGNHIVYAYFNWSVSSLGLVRRKGIKRLRERLERERGGRDS